MVGRIPYLLLDICRYKLLNKLLRSFASKAGLCLGNLIGKEKRLYSTAIDVFSELFQALNGKVLRRFLDKPQKIASPTAISNQFDMNQVGHFSHIEREMIV
jgi:hypothetical protein